MHDGHPLKNLPGTDDYLVECFRGLGVCTNDGMGVSPMSWRELDAFCNNSCYHLTRWEREQVINMSRDYVTMHHEAKELSCPSPMIKALNLTKWEYVAMMTKNVERQLDGFVDSVNEKGR